MLDLGMVDIWDFVFFLLNLLISDFRFWGFLELLDFWMVDVLGFVCCWT